MLQPITPFDVEVVNPLREEKDGGMVKGERTTVRGFVAEHHTDGPYIIFFLVYSKTKKNFMLEPACQFAPCESDHGPICPR